MCYLLHIDQLRHNLLLDPANFFIYVPDRQINIIKYRKMRIQLIKDRQLDSRQFGPDFHAT